MGWYAYNPETWEWKMVDIYESKINKFISKQKRKGIVLKKYHDNQVIPTKKQQEMIAMQRQEISKIE